MAVRRLFVVKSVNWRLQSPNSCRSGRSLSLRGFVRTDLDRILADSLTRGERVLIEGTQGFGLSILHGSYPYTAWQSCPTDWETHNDFAPSPQSRKMD